MSPTDETPECPVAAPQRNRRAGTPTNPRKGFTPVRKALAAAVVGAFLLTGAGFASNGFTANPMDAFASQTHDSQASNGLQNDHGSGAKHGVIGDATKAVAAVKTEPVAVPVDAPAAASVNAYPCAHPPLGEQLGTVSIPKFGADWKHFLIEGAEKAQLDSPGDSSPAAVANYKTAIGHNTCTQNLGELGNVGIEAHRTPNTFGPINLLEIGDPISITESKTGTVYTYGVTQTISKELPYVSLAEQEKFSSVFAPTPFDNSSLSDPTHPAKNPPTKRLLTMTSCGADIETTSKFRVYVTAELQSVTAGTAAK